MEYPVCHVFDATEIRLTLSRGGLTCSSRVSMAATVSHLPVCNIVRQQPPQPRCLRMLGSIPAQQPSEHSFIIRKTLAGARHDSVSRSHKKAGLADLTYFLEGAIGSSQVLDHVKSRRCFIRHTYTIIHSTLNTCGAKRVCRWRDEDQRNDNGRSLRQSMHARWYLPC